MDPSNQSDYTHDVTKNFKDLYRRVAQLEMGAGIGDAGQLGKVIGQHLSLPGLRGFWPMAPIDSGGNAQDISGHGHHLTYNGNPTFNVDSLVPYCDFDGTGDYLSRADESDLDITGTESYVATDLRGLTLGGWFWVDSQDDYDGLIGKTLTTGDQRGYWLRLGVVANERAAFVVNSGGTSLTNKTQASANGSVPTSAWRFIIGRFDPSTHVAIYVNGTWATNTTSVPASIFNNTSDFMIGARNAGGNNLDGRASLCFLCAAAISDAIITQIFESSRGLYGV